MGTRKRFLPFGFYPGHWGLSGIAKQIAEIEYRYTGYERDIALAKLQYKGEEQSLKLLDIELEYNKITQNEYNKQVVELTYSGTNKDIELLNLRRQKDGLTDLQYEKELATIKQEPWVCVVGIQVDSGKAGKGSVELDWNQLFIAQLETEGYAAPSDDALVEQWFNELCKNIALESFSGIGDFDEKISTSGLDGRMHIHKESDGSGKTIIR